MRWLDSVPWEQRQKKKEQNLLLCVGWQPWLSWYSKEEVALSRKWSLPPMYILTSLYSSRSNCHRVQILHSQSKATKGNAHTDSEHSDRKTKNVHNNNQCFLESFGEGQKLSLKIKDLREPILNKWNIKNKGHEMSRYLTEVQTLSISFSAVYP